MGNKVLHIWLPYVDVLPRNLSITVHHVLGSDKRIETHSASGSSFYLVIVCPAIPEASPLKQRTQLGFPLSLLGPSQLEELSVRVLNLLQLQGEWIHS